MPQDYAQAHMWFNLAASHRTILCASHLRRSKAATQVAAKMTPDQIAEAQRMAREWKPRQ